MALQLANFPVPAPRPAKGLLDNINEGLGLAQTIFQTAYTPRMIEADIAHKEQVGMPELMRAQHIYQQFSSRLGDDHPVTQEALANYRLMQNEIRQKMQYQAAVANGLNWRSLPNDAKAASIATQIDAGQPIVNPSDIFTGTPPAGLSGTPNLPISQDRIKRLQQLFGYGDGNAPAPQVTPPSQIDPKQPESFPQSQQQPKGNIPASQSQTAEDQKNALYNIQAGVPKLEAKNMDELMTKVQDAAISSQNIIESLYKANSAYEQSPPEAKGAVFGSLAQYNPNMQIAIKNMRDVMLTLGVSKFRGAGGLRLAGEFKAVQDSLLSEKLDPPAMYAISKRLEMISRQVQAVSSIAQDARANGIKSPEDVRGLMEAAVETYPLVDKEGMYHPENVNKAENLISGLDFPLDDFVKASKKAKMPLAKVVSEYAKKKEKMLQTIEEGGGL